MTLWTVEAGVLSDALELWGWPPLPLSANDVYVYILKDLLRASVAVSHAPIALEGPS